METGQQIEIEHPAARWRLEFDRPALERASQGWESLYTKARQAADAITRDANRVYGPQWQGQVAEGYHKHRKKLTTKLDGVGEQAARAAGIVAHISGSLDAAQTQLADSFRRAAAVCVNGQPVTVDGTTLVFRVADVTAKAVVEREAQQAVDIRKTVTAALRADAAELRKLKFASLYVTDTEMDYGGAYWAGTREAKASVMTVDNQMIFNTGTGNDNVEVHPDPATGGLVVVVNGTSHSVPAGMEPVIRTGEGNDVVQVVRGTNVKLTVLGGAGDDDLGSVPPNLTTDPREAFPRTNFTRTGGSGAGGDDTFLGGRGDDKIRTGAGNNYASGGAGRDYVEGGSGADVLRGGRGNDTVYGLDGQDRLSGGAGSNYLDGGAGADTILGGKNNDVMFGGLGGDRLIGGRGDDKAFGGEGVDQADLGSGRDSAYLQKDDTSSGAERALEVQYRPGIGQSFIHIDGSKEFQDRVASDLEALRSIPDQRMLQEFERIHNTTALRDASGNLVLDASGNPVYAGDVLTIREVPNPADTAEAPPFSTTHGRDYVVYYDPTITVLPDGTGREIYPMVALYHEDAHVVQDAGNYYENATMPQAPGGSTNNPRIGEREAVGLTIDQDLNPATPDAPSTRHPVELTENWIRRLLGMPERTRY